MKLESGKILIGFSEEVIKKFFSGMNTYQSVLKNKTEDDESLIFDEDFILFNSQGNDNFLSLEHSFNFGAGSKIVLSFIDPKQEFEKKLFNKSLIKNIANYFNKDDENKSTPLTTKNNVDQKNNIIPLEGKYLEAIKEELENQFGEKDFYISYGVGENPENWAGPFLVQLGGANIDIQNSRKITLIFHPLVNDLLTTTKKFNISLDGLESYTFGESKQLKINNAILPNTYGDEPVYDVFDNLSKSKKASLEEATKQLITDYNNKIQAFIEDLIPDSEDILEGLSVKTVLSDIDFHSIIVDTIRNYIQRATGNNNVIVLLPNLNIICFKAIADQLKTQRVEPINSQQSSNKINIGSSTKALADLFDDPLDKITSRLGSRILTFFRSFLELVGLNLVKNRQKIEETVIAGQLYSKFEVEQYEKPSPAIKSLFQSSYAILYQTESGKLPKHSEVIKNIINNINEIAKGVYQINYQVFEENSVDLLDFWAKTTGEVTPGNFPLFGGYQKFIKNKSAIIVGDAGLIKSYLFGQINLKEKQKTISDLKSKQKEKLFELIALQETFPQESLTESIENDLKKEITNLEGKIQNIIPLHPFDRAILTNELYVNNVKNIVSPKINLKNTFGKFSLIPDEFAYSELTQEEKTLIEEENIPIFRYNTKNPNIINLSLAANYYYFNLLNLGFEKQINDIASVGIGGELFDGASNFGVTSLQQAISFLLLKNYSLGLSEEARQAIEKELLSKISLDSVENNAEPQKLVYVAAAFLKLLEKRDNKTFIKVKQSLGGGPHDIMVSLITNLHRQMYQLSIKTLPAYHLSKTFGGTINKNVVVFAKDQPIIRTKTFKPGPLNTFLSGVYSIVGFKHTLSNKELSSEFKLIKQIVDIGF